ncbi:MAG: Na+/H+ antiporter NhaC family protein, partial [Planctomycetes bacterium]|nr:Na+/H+ antiporter NhaC family protein [Planctomycetota bacterium]
LAGCVVFFDDYANAMIVGPSMRPVTDRLKISRAKLAYIVDSTAAPVASIALFGTWIGAEVGFIGEGLNAIVDRPAFLADMEPYSAFLGSLLFRFYAVLALVMVFIIGVLGRDFGPMRKAEQAAADGSSDLETSANDTESEPSTGRIWYALVPIMTLIGATITVLFVTGLAEVNQMESIPSGADWLRAVLSKGESYDSILYGAMAAILVAAAIALFTRSLTLAKTVDSATDVMSRMLPTFIVLVLAWSLSQAMQDLQLAQVSQTLLEEGGFQPVWLPALIFLAAAIVSFATGTSWGTMGILCPATVQIAAGLFADLPADQALSLFYASVGAVLSGAIFGDHCSPISDTTVLSSLASECSLEQHVWTQMPYALVVAVVAVLCGDTLCNRFGQPWWIGMLAGAAALVLIVFIFGRKPRVTDAAPA